VSLLLVDQPMLQRLAAQGAYNWMASLRPLRQWRLVNGGRQCCGKPAPTIPPELFRQVAASPQFVSELQQLKARLKLVKLIVNAGGYRADV